MSALPIDLGVPTTGIDYHMPQDKYLALDALGSSDIKRLLRSPAHYRAAADTALEPTDAMVIGSAIHLGVLEPARFDVEVVQRPTFDRRTTIGKAAHAEWTAANEGKLALDAADFDAVRRAVDSARAHPAACALLAEGAPEVTLQWTDEATQAPCRARFDWLRPDSLICDLKTTIDASPEGFRREIAKWGYHYQAAHYGNGHRAVLRCEPAGFVFIAVEKVAPFAVGVYMLGEQSIASASGRVDEALRRWRDGTDTGVWPAYSSLVEPIEVPTWAQ